MTQNDDTDEYIRAFTRKKHSTTTKKYVQYVLSFLSDHDDWVRSGTIASALIQPDKIPNGSTFYHLLNSLVKWGIIERRSEPSTGPGKNPTSYRIVMKPSKFCFMSRDELIRQLQERS